MPVAIDIAGASEEYGASQQNIGMEIDHRIVKTNVLLTHFKTIDGDRIRCAPITDSNICIIGTYPNRSNVGRKLNFAQEREVLSLAIVRKDAQLRTGTIRVAS